ncbi:5-hydroxyisourate hydrolase [Globomyces pollinis-pini]|nr:5-hydroxyisourate hydrolase [Globomyces pollinis-pini]
MKFSQQRINQVSNHLTLPMAKSRITTHVLDTAHGVAAQNVLVHLHYYEQDEWKLLGSEKTNSDGRCQGLNVSNGIANDLNPGLYRLTFDIKSYYKSLNIQPFFPEAQIVFQVSDPPNQHYHVPLVVTPFAYNTYRGT